MSREASEPSWGPSVRSVVPAQAIWSAITHTGWCLEGQGRSSHPLPPRCLVPSLCGRWALEDFSPREPLHQAGRVVWQPGRVDLKKTTVAFKNQISYKYLDF